MSLAAFCCLALPGARAHAANQFLLERKRDGSRADAVHRINLYDATGGKIDIHDPHPQPFSTRKTCGECHDYEKIRHGWHFGAGAGMASGQTANKRDGRAGEPWLLSDAITGTQLPVTARGWKGTWQPEQIGLTPWGFAKAFGTHLPGGGLVEVDLDSTAPQSVESRWPLSGSMEINCLACHGGAPMQDASAWATQVGSENFAWAATAASGLASVTGAVKGLPDSWDLVNGPNLDDPKHSSPEVVYNPAFFDAASKAFIPIKARPDDNRCLACHSTMVVGAEVCASDRDVHQAAGLSCVDCHRNGLDHQINRGTAGKASGVEASCRSCHLGEGAAGNENAVGQLGAPRPLHKGLPPIHFEKLSCTVCHSGPRPGAESRQVRTSRAHRLGNHVGVSAGLPQITTPVFARQDDGLIYPCNVVWPSFWGRMKGDTIAPLLPEAVRARVGTILTGRDHDTTGTELTLTQYKVARALMELARLDKGEGEPVYVSGGKLHRVDSAGRPSDSEHPAAQPYAWPIGHDVRPARQALGSGGCGDCHDGKTPYRAGRVRVADPLKDAPPQVLAMTAFTKPDASQASLLDVSFIFRPAFKLVGFASSGLLLGIISFYGLSGLGALCRILGRRRW